MTVEEVNLITYTQVYILEDNNTYYRHSAENWNIVMGDSIEVLYDYDKITLLESAYQNFIKKGSN